MFLGLQIRKLNQTSRISKFTEIFAGIAFSNIHLILPYLYWKMHSFAKKMKIRLEID